MLQKFHTVLMSVSADSSLFSIEFRPCRYFHLHYSFNSVNVYAIIIVYIILTEHRKHAYTNVSHNELKFCCTMGMQPYCAQKSEVFVTFVYPSLKI